MLDGRSQQKSAPNSLAQAMEEILHNREPEIIAFVSGVMNPITRQAFVEELSNNQALRLVSAQARENLPQVTMSEQASDLLAKMTNAIHQGNCLFPGNSYIAGLENRPDIRPSREAWYNKVIEFSGRLLALGELEELALENRFRALQNITNGREAQLHFKRSTEMSSIDGALGAVFGLFEPGTPPGCYNPLTFSPRVSSNVPFGMRAAQDLSDERIARDLAVKLHDLFPGFKENGYAMHWDAAKDLGNESGDRKIITHILTQPTCIQALGEFISSPISSAKPKHEVVSKAVAAKILLEHARGDPESVAFDLIFSAFDALLERNKKGAMSEAAVDQLKLFSVVLTKEASTSDKVWSRLLALYQNEFKHGVYGIHPDNKSFVSSSAFFVESLKYLGERFKRDETALEVVKFLTSIPNPNVRYSSCHALQEIPVSSSIPILLLFLVEDRIKAEDIFGSDYKQLAAATIYRIAKKSAPELTKLEFNGEEIHPVLKGVKNAAEGIERAIEIISTPGKYGPGPFAQASMLLTALALTDRERMASVATKVIPRWSGQSRAIEEIIDFASEQKLDNLRTTCLNLLIDADLRSDDGESQRSFEKLEAWGLSQGEIAKAIVSRIPPRGLSEQFLWVAVRRASYDALPILRSALYSDNPTLKRGALRAMTNPNSRLGRFVNYGDVAQFLECMTDKSPLNPGIFGGPRSVAEEAESALCELVSEPFSKMLVQDIVQAERARQLEQPPTSIRTPEFMRHLEKVEEYLRRDPKHQEVESGTATFMKIFKQFKHIPRILELFLNSYTTRDVAELSDDEIASRYFVQSVLQDNFLGLDLYLSSVADYDGRMVQAIMHGHTLLERKDPPETRIILSATNLIHTELGEGTIVYDELQKSFITGLSEVNGVPEGFNQLKHACVVAALYRLGRESEAQKYMKDLSIKDDKALGALGQQLLVIGRDKRIHGKREDAFKLLQHARTVLEGLRTTKERKGVLNQIDQELEALRK